MGALIEDPSHPTEITLSHKKATFCFWGLTGVRRNFAPNGSTTVTVLLGHFFYSYGRGDFFHSCVVFLVTAQIHLHLLALQE